MSYFTDELALAVTSFEFVWHFLQNRDDCHREIRKISRTGATIYNCQNKSGGYLLVV